MIPRPTHHDEGCTNPLCAGLCMPERSTQFEHLCSANSTAPANVLDTVFSRNGDGLLHLLAECINECSNLGKSAYYRMCN